MPIRCSVKETASEYVRMHSLNTTMGKHQASSNGENIHDTQYWPVFIQSVKVMKDEIEDLSQIGGDYGAITTKCSAGSWLGS